VNGHNALKAAGDLSPRKMWATALVCMPAIAWATPASAQQASAGADSLSVFAAPSSAQSIPDVAYSLSAPAAQATEQEPPAAEPGPAETSPAGDTSAPSGDENMAMKMTNPVTDLWLIEMEFNNYKLESDNLSPVSGKWVHNFYLQPVLPVSLTKDLSLITRPVVTVFQSVPYVKGISPTGEVNTGRKTDFGDTILAQVVSPKLPQPWIFAAGPTWIFPTAGSRLIGQGKWQLGPAVGGGVVTPKYMVAALVQQWWSFAGKDDRKSTSQMAILPKVYAFWGDGWSVGYSGQIQVDWKARDGNRWTVPAGAALGKVVKFGMLPVQIRVGGQYFPIRPEFGPKWGFTVQITPLLPRLIKNPIFE
jgi:hypothetical protein